MAEPYYLKIRDPKEFLRTYLSIYKGDYSKRRAQKIISLFPELRNKNVLDIGCGGGFYSYVASEKGGRVTLVDISPICVRAAKSNSLENGYDAEGVVADATNLPFINGYFDFILCIDLIEHVKEDMYFYERLEES